MKTTITILLLLVSTPFSLLYPDMPISVGTGIATSTQKELGTGPFIEASVNLNKTVLALNISDFSNGKHLITGSGRDFSGTREFGANTTSVVLRIGRQFELSEQNNWMIKFTPSIDIGLDDFKYETLRILSGDTVETYEASKSSLQKGCSAEFSFEREAYYISLRASYQDFERISHYTYEEIERSGVIGHLGFGFKF